MNKASSATHSVRIAAAVVRAGLGQRGDELRDLAACATTHEERDVHRKLPGLRVWILELATLTSRFVESTAETWSA